MRRIATDAVAEVILDQGSLGGRDRLFDRLQLHGDIGAGSSVLDHVHDAAEGCFGQHV